MSSQYLSKLALTGATLSLLMSATPGTTSDHRVFASMSVNSFTKDSGFVPIVGVNPPLPPPPPDPPLALSLAGHGPRASKTGLTFTVHYAGDQLPGAASNTQLVAIAVYDDDLIQGSGTNLETETGSVVEETNNPGVYEYQVTLDEQGRGMPRQVIFTMKQLNDPYAANPYPADVDTYIWNRPY